MLDPLAHASTASRPRTASHLLSFDVEHWYEGYRLRNRGGWEQISPRDPANVERLLALLGRFGQQATFFATGRFATEFPGVIMAIAAAGHEIASHGFDHIPIPRFSGPAAFRDDLRRSLAILEDLTGRPIQGFRAPCWTLTEANRGWVFEALAAEGLTYDSSHFAWGPPLGAHANAPLGPRRIALDDGAGSRVIWEIPPSVLAVRGWRVPAAGGFYLRFFPEAVVRAALRQAAAAGRPGLLYLHPYDMDASCPRLPGPWYFHLMRYYRLGRTEGVLRRLLASYRFTSIAAWLAGQEHQPGRQEYSSQPARDATREHAPT
ncbi:MAG: polysaccharide deacetylase family protein [Chloroflexi bacterium]|nr:polysaccharide deacetylase family protein [Chloroflexota bacterium]